MGHIDKGTLPNIVIKSVGITCMLKVGIVYSVYSNQLGRGRNYTKEDCLVGAIPFVFYLSYFMFVEL